MQARFHYIRSSTSYAGCQEMPVPKRPILGICAGRILTIFRHGQKNDRIRNHYRAKGGAGQFFLLRTAGSAPDPRWNIAFFMSSSPPSHGRKNMAAIIMNRAIAGSPWRPLMAGGSSGAIPGRACRRGPCQNMPAVRESPSRRAYSGVRARPPPDSPLCRLLYDVAARCHVSKWS